MSVGLFRWCKCCASYNNMFCVLLPYSTSCIYSKLVASWCSFDHNTYQVLDFGLLLLNSPLLPLNLSYISTPRTFLYYWWSFKVLVENWPCIWFPCEFFHFFVFIAELKLILNVFGSSFFCHIFLLYEISCFCREYLVFLASYSCTDLVNLSSPCLMYLQRPTIAALYADSISTIPRPPLCLLM